MHPDYLRAAIADTPRVAVYGTLKQGFNNAHWLNGARRLGSDTTRSLTLYDIGPYPWVYLYNPGVAGKRAICEGGWEMPYTDHN